VHDGETQTFRGSTVCVRLYEHDVYLVEYQYKMFFACEHKLPSSTSFAPPSVKCQTKVLVYVWSREHLGELNVRPLPQALPTHDVVAENHILRERLEIPSLLVYMMQRKKRHMGESKENYSSGGIHVHTRS